MARHSRSLDQATAERLAAGGLGPDDAPPGFRRVADLLQAAAVPPATPEQSVQPELVAAMATAARMEAAGASPTTRRSPVKKLLLGKAVIAFSALTLSASAAGAATGNLPDPIQAKVAGAVEHVGVKLPHPGKGPKAAKSDHANSGVERVTEGCEKADDGTFARNRGQYLKQERAKGSEALAAAKLTRCGMPGNSDDADDTKTADPAETTDPAVKDHGKSGDDHGKAPEDKGKPADDPAPADEDQGKAGEDQGKAGENHGKAGENHGKAPEDKGKPADDDPALAPEDDGGAEKGDTDQGDSPENDGGQ